MGSSTVGVAQQRTFFHVSSPAPAPADQSMNPTTTESQLVKQTKPSPRRRMAGDSDVLPIYDPRSAIGKRNQLLRSRFSDKWIHAIPAVVLLCLFILCWFCYPVSLEIKDGRIVAIHGMDPLNKTRLEIAVLAVATAPDDVVFAAAVPHFQNFTPPNHHHDDDPCAGE